MSDYLTEKYNDDNYIIVIRDEDYKDELIKEINCLIENGYVPIGGITVRAGTRSGANLMQAMIKSDLTLQKEGKS